MPSHFHRPLRKSLERLVQAGLWLIGYAAAHAMEIGWTRMTGQWPVECSPVVIKAAITSEDRILVLNRGGQLLVWAGNGTPVGPGQDGMVAQLPEGRWTTAPTVIEASSPIRYVVASVEGKVVALDRNYRLLWQHLLPDKTVWGRALPALVGKGSETMLIFNDLSGTITCLNLAGRVAWTTAGIGAGKAPPTALSSAPGEDQILVPQGTQLVCCQASGRQRWRCDFGAEIVTQPAVLSDGERRVIVCGTSTGKLFALNTEGKLLWEQASGDPLSHSVTCLPRKQRKPLIVFTGLWGNLHAIDLNGQPAWTHLFRAKVRASPRILDIDGDGRNEIFVPTFHQHVYRFDEDGRLTDDTRLSGIIPAAATPIVDPVTGRDDLLVATTTLLAYRLKAGQPASPYGNTGASKNVQLNCDSLEQTFEGAGVVIKNPDGALICANIATSDINKPTILTGRVTARSALELDVPDQARTNQRPLRVMVTDTNGNLILDKVTTPGPRLDPQAKPEALLAAWSTLPFAPFDENRLTPAAHELFLGRTNEVLLANLYKDEADQGAFIVSSAHHEALRVRIALSPLARTNGSHFGGTVMLRQVVATGSVNGEKVPDALPPLGEAGLVSIPPSRSIKLWLSVDGRGAEAGNYNGRILITPLIAGATTVELPFSIEVLPQQLGKTFPLSLCTWDYVPNRWFPSKSDQVLDDMARHGVNIFPRTTLPTARLDAKGRLSFDWQPLDAELTRLDRRGTILFQLNHPPIEFAGPRSAEEKFEVETRYVRALRDYLKKRGWSCDKYAFYLLDEPGLDYGTNIPVLLETGKLIRAADRKLRTYTDPVPGLSWKDYERIEPLVDVWAPNMRLVSGLLSGDPRIERIMQSARGSNVWSYECVSQVKSLSPLRYNRSNAWRARFFGLNGIGFWTHSTTQADLWLAGKTVEDEYALVYPGETPVPSVRWEAVRDGLEDVAAIELLERQIDHHQQNGTKLDLVQQARNALRIAFHDVMELSDETFVESRDFLKEGDRRLDHTWTDIELFRQHRAEIARLTAALEKP